MKNILMFEDDKRVMDMVEEANSIGAAVIYNDVEALIDYQENLELSSLAKVRDKFLKEDKTFGMMNTKVSEDKRSLSHQFVFVTAREDQREYSIITMAHEIGHMLDLNRRGDEFLAYHISTTQFEVEINAWKEGFKLLKRKGVRLNLSLNEIIDDFVSSIDTYVFGYKSFYEGRLQDEVVELIKDYYKEVVING
jgi:hypothetical protein